MLAKPRILRQPVMAELLDVFEGHRAASPDCGPGVRNAFQKLGVMFEAIIEPVLFRAEANEEAGRTPVTRDDHLVLRCQPEIS